MKLYTSGVRSQRGMTLIELMIVVAIIAVLASVAYPSYRNYNMKANRSQAGQLLLNIANREELYMLDKRQYSTALDSTGLNIVQEGWTCTAASCTNNFYTVTVSSASCTAPCYVVSAAPKSNSYQASDGTMTLDNAGTKTRGGASGW